MLAATDLADVMNGDGKHIFFTVQIIILPDFAKLRREC